MFSRSCRYIPVHKWWRGSRDRWCWRCRRFECNKRGLHYARWYLISHSYENTRPRVACQNRHLRACDNIIRTYQIDLLLHARELGSPANCGVKSSLLIGWCSLQIIMYVNIAMCFYDSQSDWPRFLGFLLAIVEAHGYVYIVNDVQRPRANEKSGFHSSVSMNELPQLVWRNYPPAKPSCLLPANGIDKK